MQCCKIFQNFLEILKSICILFVMSSISGKGCMALNCFKCISTAREYPPCDDPFHNNYTQDILETPCWAGRKQRNGVFPASTCVKLAGVYAATGKSLIVRGCALDSGTLTIDTELVRMSHCGGFYYEGNYAIGCVQNCYEDGCNAGNKKYSPSVLIGSAVIKIFYYYLKEYL